MSDTIPAFTRHDFSQLLTRFNEADYRYSRFDREFGPERCLLLRHDVDFSLSDAAEMAALEADHGAFATYFVLLTSDFYNPWSAVSRTELRRMQEQGARLALHFDPTTYDDLDRGFESERRAFEDLTGEALTIVSLHRPRDFLKENNRRLAGVRHTYEDLFFRELTYISDSGGSFRYGHPLRSEAFKEGRSIHLNLHPIWWTRQGDSPSDKLRSFEQSWHAHMLAETSRNCLTFDGRSSFDQAVLRIEEQPPSIAAK